MLLGPVFTVELLTTARRARYYLLRLIYGLIVLYFIVQTAPWHLRNRFATFEEMSELGEQIFATVVTIQGIAILFLTPAFVAGVIAEEKRRKTLHYLLASTLTSREIVLGKLTARLLHVAVYLTIGLPILVLATLFGGVDPDDVWLTYGATVSTMLFLASLSILVSVRAQRARDAILLVYLLELAWLFLPLTVSTFLPMAGGNWSQVYQWIEPVNDWIGWSSPFYMLSETSGAWSGSPAFGPVLWMMGLQIAFSAFFLTWAVVRLRARFRNEGASARWTARIGNLWRGRRLLGRPDCGDDAMLWKERYVSRVSVATKLLGVTLTLILLGLLTYAIQDSVREAAREVASFGYGSDEAWNGRQSLNMSLRVASTLTYIIWGIAVATAAATSVTGEREEDTWTSLTATPLSGLEILRGKMLGAIWGTRWVLLILLGLWTLGVVLGAIHPFGFVMVFVATAVYVWFAAALGLFLSLNLRSSGRALAATMAVLLTTNVGYLMCCLPVQPSTALVAVGITPMFVAAAPVSYREVSEALTIRQSSDSGELFVAGLVSVVIYGAAAAFLTGHAFAWFDQLIDRPRRPFIGPSYPTPSKPLKPLASADDESETD